MAKVENNETRTIYKCAICGKEHSTILERANCEQECSKKLEIAKKKELEEKKKREQEERKAELDTALKCAYELYTKYLEDYGSYSFNFSKEEVDNLINTLPIFKSLRPFGFLNSPWI